MCGTLWAPHICNLLGLRRLADYGAETEANVSATYWKMFDSSVPRTVRAPMMATATRAAIRPYSMAVAPDSSLTKFLIMLIIVWVSFLNCPEEENAANL